MKKKFICLLGVLTLFTTGCKKDSMDDITIYTTTYPIEYITNALYGENSNVYSIYPNEIIELSDKLIKDYNLKGKVGAFLRILGIDPGYAIVGCGIVEYKSNNRIASVYEKDGIFYVIDGELRRFGKVAG